jgi:hypothetical protein
MSDGGRSGISLWLAGLLGIVAYRRGRRRGEDAAGAASASSGSGGWGGAPDGGPALRQVRLPDGREVLQVHAELFFREAGDTGVWRRVEVLGTPACQDALELTMSEVAPGQRSAQDVPVVLMPVESRRGVTAIDVYATGGRVGHLPEYVVGAVGEGLLATHRANDRPCAVMSRIEWDATGGLVVEVLVPDAFAPGPPRTSGTPGAGSA